MAKSDDFLSVLCIYSAADESLKLKFQHHFAVLYQQGAVDKIQYAEVETYQNWNLSLDEIRNHIDIIIFLLSAELLISEYVQTHPLERLFDLHYYRYITIMPVLLRPCEYEPTLFNRKTIILPENHQPVVSRVWNNLDEAIRTVVEQFQPFTESIKAHKQVISTAWNRASAMNTVFAYDAFIKNEVLNKFTKEAKKRRDVLLEERLWKKATLQPSIDTLLDYYQNAPIGKNKSEALQRIIEIEKASEIAWNDARSNDEIAFLLDYKSRFPRDKNVVAAEQMVEEILSTPLEELNEPKSVDDLQSDIPLDTQRSFETEGYGLLYMAYQNLNAEELLSLELITEYIERVERKLSGISRELEGRINYLWLSLSGILLFVLLYLGSLFFYPVETNTLLASFFRFVFPFLLLGFIAYLNWVAVNEAIRDADFCIKEKNDLDKRTVALKIAFIHRNNKIIRKSLTHLLKIEKEAVALGKRTVLDYILPEERDV